MSQSLAEVLGSYLQRSHSSVNRIATLTGVPKQTIANWLEGGIKKPRRWQDVIKVGAALHLSVADANALLKAAGQRPIDQLRSTATKSDRTLLQPFDEPVIERHSVPFQAIRDLPTFVGRDAEVAALKQAILQTGQAAICGVHGMGGVGKTTLAAHIAYQLRDDFPDGVLWARVDTSDALTILAQFADAFGKDVSDYHDLDSRAAVVRTLLSDKRVLIVLDNAEASEQVRHLLPPGTGRSAVVITTRNDLEVLDGWSRLTLQPFEANSSEVLELFARHLDRAWVTRHAASLSTIAALVGGLPLALAILAGQLRSQPGAALNDLLVQLRESNTRLSTLTREDRNLRASFDVSYNRLSPEMQHCFAALGAFGGADFAVEAAAYAMEQSITWTEAALNQLLGFSLVQPGRPHRYRLHPLLRDYALEKLGTSSAEAAAVSQRLLKFYTQALEHAEVSGYKSLVTDVGNILSILNVAEDRSWSVPFVRGANLTLKMLDALGLYSALIDLMPRAGQAAEHIDDPPLQVSIWLTLAALETDSRRQHGRAETLAQQAVSVGRAAGLWPLVCDAYILLARIAFNANRPVDAERFADEAENIAQHEQLAPALIRAANGRGWRALWHGDLDLAERNIRAHLDLAQQTSDVNEICDALSGLGYILHRRGQFADADTCYAEAIRLFEDAHGARLIQTLRARAENAVAWGHLVEATDYVSEALALARVGGKAYDILNVLIYAGDVALACHDFVSAAARWHESETQACQLDANKHAAVLCRLGRVYLEQGQLDRAARYLHEADVWTSTNDATGAIRWYLCYDLARLALAQGNLAEAAHQARESLYRCEVLKLREADESRALLSRISAASESISESHTQSG